MNPDQLTVEQRIRLEAAHAATTIVSWPGPDPLDIEQLDRVAEHIRAWIAGDDDRPEDAPEPTATARDVAEKRDALAAALEQVLACFTMAGHLGTGWIRKEAVDGWRQVLADNR